MNASFETTTQGYDVPTVNSVWKSAEDLSTKSTRAAVVLNVLTGTPSGTILVTFIRIRTLDTDSTIADIMPKQSYAVYQWVLADFINGYEPMPVED